MTAPENPLDRLAALEEAVRIMVDTMSRQGGELQALHAALHGFLRVAGPDQRIRAAVEHQLELAHAMTLGGSLNQPQVDSFTDAANLIRLAMDDHQDRSEG